MRLWVVLLAACSPNDQRLNPAGDTTPATEDGDSTSAEDSGDTAKL